MFVNLGACTTLGIFLSSLSEYSGWDLGMVGYIGTVNTIGNVILSMVAVKALSKFGARTTMLISVLACALHVHFYTFATPGQHPQPCVLLRRRFPRLLLHHLRHARRLLQRDRRLVRGKGASRFPGHRVFRRGFGAAIWVFAAGQLFKVVDFKGCYRILSIFILAIGLFSVICL